MWKKSEPEETPKPTGAPETMPMPQTSSVAAPTAPAPTTPNPQAGSARIGQSVVITGEITGSEDLTIEGRVDGTVESRQHTVVIGQQAMVKAQVFAKEVVVLGQVVGNITATAKIELRENGTVEGDLASPTVAIAEGATFRGSIDMTRQTSAENAA